MSLDAIRTNDLMPDLGNADQASQVPMLLNYIVQIKEQLGWELDNLKKQNAALRKTISDLAAPQTYDFASLSEMDYPANFAPMPNDIIDAQSIEEEDDDV